MNPLFDQFFQSQYKDRWSSLLASLRAKENQVARPNLFSQDASSLQWVLNPQFSEIPRGEDQLLQYYIMDPASILAALALQVQSGDVVLDMCAAPGGKTLILAEALRTSGELIANEMSEARRERLKKVMQQYIPREIRERFWVTGKDGGKFALTHKEKFDRILVDAPCSGERHLLENRTELEGWTESRTKKLGHRQYALMTAALLAVKPGGRIVYSTCSISPYENDDVIRTLQKKKKGFRVLDVQDELSDAVKENSVLFEVFEKRELTEYGLHFLPDQSGAGPIYLSVLERE